MKKVILVILALAFCAYAKQILSSNSAVESDSEQCGCGWASAYTCGTNDGSVCNIQCCAPFRGGSRPSQPSQPSQPSGGSNCGCGWANANTCGSNDGSVCNIQCCAPFRSSSQQPSQPVQHSQPSGWQNGVTTRYWDCCKPSCSWPSNTANAQGVVRSCSRDGVSIAPQNGVNTCGGGGYGGPNFSCSNQQPFTRNGVMYGFVASNIDCCQCLELQFTSGPVAGKTMIVQVTNKGGDLGSNHFDIQIPGGGVGIFAQGCPNQWGTWNGGATYGGIGSAAQCAGLPAPLQAGCYWRFNDFKNADNPSVRFRRITCPSELVSITGCSA